MEALVLGGSFARGVWMEVMITCPVSDVGTGGGRTMQPVQGWRQSHEGYRLQTQITNTHPYCDAMYLYVGDSACI